MLVSTASLMGQSQGIAQVTLQHVGYEHFNLFIHNPHQKSQHLFYTAAKIDVKKKIPSQVTVCIPSLFHKILQTIPEFLLMLHKPEYANVVEI
jgi:hypothetical protein